MQIISWVIVIISSEFLIFLVPLYWPQFLVENHFLQNFINHELLNILAIIMTVTAASVANIHLVFNRAEETIKKPNYFGGARKEINEGFWCLIVLFLVAIIALIIRSSFIGDLFWVSLLNGLGLVILLMYILVLIDITTAVFAMHPFSPPSDEP